MKKSEIWIIAYIYSIICFIIYFGIEEHKSKKLYQDFYKAKVIAVELYDENEALHQGHKSLNDELDKTIKIQKIINDLSQVPKESQSLVLANAFNESSLNYEVIHKGKFDKTTVGISGIKSNFWIKAIPELNEDNINSLYGGYLVLNHLLAKHNGNEFKALAEYKGSRTNFIPVYKVLEIKKRIEL